MDPRFSGGMTFRTAFSGGSVVRVDELEPRGDDPGGPPAARQHHDPVDDEPREEQDQEDEQHRRDDLPEESHGPRSVGAPRVPCHAGRIPPDAARTDLRTG